MSDSLTDSAEHCSGLLRRRDEDRWLAARYAPADTRRALIAVGALHSELRRVPAIVSEPALGEIRLQWWREALSEIREGKPARQHPIALEIAATGLAGPRHADNLERAIDAAARPLYEPAFSDIDDLGSWLEAADGAVDLMRVALCDDAAPVDEKIAAASAAFSMAREGALIAPALKEAAHDHAGAFWSAHRSSFRSAPSTVTPVIAPFGLIPAYLRRGLTPFPLRKRLRLFASVAFG